jgi:hypothetical protein
MSNNITTNNINNVTIAIQNDFDEFVRQNDFLDSDPAVFSHIVHLLPIFFSTSNNYEFNLHLQELSGGNVDIPLRDNNSAYKLIENDVNERSDDVTCAICLEDYNNNVNATCVITNCNHYFCKKCIDEWFNISSKCPICMKNFND